MRAFPSVLFVACLLSGCATSYKCSETELAPDLYRVAFHGNGNTSPERAQDFTMLSASELTLRHGYSYFAIIDEKQTTTTQSYVSPGFSTTSANASANTYGNYNNNPYGGGYHSSTYASGNSSTFYQPPQTRTIYQPHSFLTVRAFKEKPEDIYTFDAAFLERSLKGKYKIK